MLSAVLSERVSHLDHEATRRTGRTVGGFIQDGSRGCAVRVVCAVCSGRAGKGVLAGRASARRIGVRDAAYSGDMSEIPLEEASRQVTDAAHDAARGQVVYLTEHGERLAAIVPAELAAELENLTPDQFRELLEDFADAQVARESLAEVAAGGEPVPADQVWAELGLGT
jgi:antitoxin (DNA-binding transcriptional repressor) of toxin-antitoxin stability system